jgi:hypothetical protein
MSHDALFSTATRLLPTEGSPRRRGVLLLGHRHRAASNTSSMLATARKRGFEPSVVAQSGDGVTCYLFSRKE